MKLNLTDEQKQQLRSNMESIRDYFLAQTSDMEEIGLNYIFIDFGERCEINVDTADEGKVNGRTGGLYIYFDPEKKGYKCDTAAWDYESYAVALMNEWPCVKSAFTQKLQDKRDTLSLIANFEV